MRVLLLISLTALLVGFAIISHTGKTSFADRVRRGMLWFAVPIIVLAVVPVLIVLTQRLLGE